MELNLSLFVVQSDSFVRVAEILSFVFLGNLLLVERRGQHQPIDSSRQIEIRTLLNSMPDAVMIVDPSARIVDVNGATEKISGMPRDELIGTSINNFVKRIEREVATNVLRFEKPIVPRALAGEIVGVERRLRNPRTGEEVELLISAHPIRDGRGEVKGALVIARDITELSQLQRRLADIERHQAIGYVAAGIAHDFNNTLQTISQAVAVLEMGPDRPAEERKIFLEMIQNAVRRGAEVLSRIRDYLRSGTADREYVDVHSVLEESLELTRPMWQARLVKVHRSIHSGGLVLGNKADVLRVFTNLIINGLQAMGNAGELSVGCKNDGNTVHVWVRDTGHGIVPEVRTRIFNPYFTTKAGGTGLGLSGAQKIMLELGGNISFTSDPGKGTQFDLKFPKAERREDTKSV
jgi:two-component system sensor histidine kinase HydH